MSTAADHLDNAISSFESDREGQAAGSIRAALRIVEQDDPKGVRTLLLAAVKAFNQGNDRVALAHTRSALERQRAA